jgi:hypothetical protein
MRYSVSVFPRERWGAVKNRKELAGAGVYVLTGPKTDGDDDDLPQVYIGQTDDLRSRLDNHYDNKLFWDRAVIFTSTNASLDFHATEFT